MLIRDFVAKMAKHAGIPEEDEHLKTFTANKDLAELPDELSDAIAGKLLTTDSAKANSELQKYFKAEILNGADAKIKKVAQDLGLSEEQRMKLTINENTYERIAQLAKFVKANADKELEDLKATGVKDEKGKEQIETLNKEIERLNAELKTANEGVEQKIGDLSQAHSEKLKDLKLQTLLAGYNWANKDVPVEANVITAQTLLQQQLSKDGYQLKLDGDVLKLQTNDGTDVFVDNQKMSVRDYANSVVSNNKLLAASKPAPAPPAGAPTNGVSSLNDQYLKEFIAGSEQPQQ